MSRSWEQRGSEVTYLVRLDGDQRLRFEATGPGVRGTPREGVVGSVWIEEFPDDERWHEWIEEHFGGETLREIQSAVTSELETLYATRRQTFSAAAERLETSGDEAERRTAIDRMRSLAVRYEDLAEPAVEQFTEELDEGDDDTRRRVAEALRRVSATHPETVEPARGPLRRALNDDHPNVRLDAARALVLLAEAGCESVELDAVVDALVGLLHEHKRWFSQGPVAGLLGDLGREHPSALGPAVEPLARFILGDLRGGSSTSGLGRSSAVQALVEIGSRDFEMIEDHVEVFFEKLDAPRPGVRGQCAAALGLVGTNRPELVERTADVLADRLDDTRFVRNEAAEALRSLHAEHPETVESIVDNPDVLEPEGEFAP